jgi:hypothetical protein
MARDLHSERSTRTRASTRASLASQEINIRFLGDLGSFSRQVSSSITVNDLYRLAFQGVKGRYTRFELHSKNELAPPSERLLSSTNIQNNSDVHIIVPASTAGNPHTAGGGSQYEDLCLVKVYKSHDMMLFSFWVPRNTSATMASIIFRYWRFLAAETYTSWIQSRKVWLGMKDVGDGKYRGQPQDHWASLFRFFTPEFAQGTLAKEDLFGSRSAQDEDVHMDDLLANPTVLKVYISGEPAKEDKKSGKTLSRVRYPPTTAVLQLADSSCLVGCSEDHVRCLYQQTTCIQLQDSPRYVLIVSYHCLQSPIQNQ